jgi:hypothetical protein
MPNNLKLISGRVAVTPAANVAADRYQYLDLSSAEPNLGTGNTGDVLIFNSAYPGGRQWIPQGNIAGSIGESAYDEANTASANTLYILGVDLWQNSEIIAINTLAQTAFDTANTKLSQSGGTITGSLNVTQDLAVTGNLTVLGIATTINTSSFTVTDSLITLGTGNYTSDLLDIGIAGHYNDGTNAHTGFIRDPGTKEWYVFKGYTPEVTANNNVNINHASFAKANVNAEYFKGAVVFPDGSIQNTAINITNDTTSNDVYYPLLSKSNNGTLVAANTSSSKLTYVPSSGTLTVVDLNSTSDIKFKDNVKQIESALSILNNINGYSFDWKETGKKSYGLIANELQKVLPELVNHEERGLSVSYLPLIAILIEAIKEQQKQIDKLKQ